METNLGTQMDVIIQKMVTNNPKTLKKPFKNA